MILQIKERKNNREKNKIKLICILMNNLKIFPSKLIKFSIFLFKIPIKEFKNLQKSLNKIIMISKVKKVLKAQK